jgi:hypothetical protein
MDSEYSQIYHQGRRILDKTVYQTVLSLVFSNKCAINILKGITILFSGCFEAFSELDKLVENGV